MLADKLTDIGRGCLKAWLDLLVAQNALVCVFWNDLVAIQLLASNSLAATKTK